MSDYNTTQLDPDKTFEKHVYHRDQFAHYLRWTHILKNAKIGMNVLDFGSGTGNLLQLLYRNRYKGKEYLGLEYRQSVVNEANYKYCTVDWANFKQQDLTKPDFLYKPEDGDWDIIASFEVAEHVGKANVPQFLSNMYKHMSDKTTAYLSTPVYDACVGPAANHIINDVIGEMTYEEFEQHLKDAGFKIQKVYGTFASMTDYKHLLNDWQKKMFDTLSEYYDVNLISVLMAPMFPKQSRNCLWVCKK